MAAGRLPDAEARYRDAISAANDLGVGDRRERAHELALAYYGLAVALDRDEQPVAARETMLRALAHDPTAAVLKVASAAGGDLFFVPEGDVLYYLGLAAEAEGRDGDAQAAFREFLDRSPRGRWARAAEAHLARKSRRHGAGERRRRRRRAAHPRARHRAGDGRDPGAAHGRRLARAARRFSTSAWTACACTLRATLRIAIEMDIDARGKITRVVVKAPPPFDERFARCVESATKQRLRFSVRRAGRGPRLARTELIIGDARSRARARSAP